MRLWQRVDPAVQGLLLLGFTVAVLVLRWNFRWWYHRVVLAALVLAVSSSVLGSLLPLLFAMIFILLFAAPVMALEYFALYLYELPHSAGEAE